jgi:hypothetical protein
VALGVRVMILRHITFVLHVTRMTHYITVALATLAITLTAFSTTHAQQLTVAPPVTLAAWSGFGFGGVRPITTSLAARIGPVGFVGGVSMATPDSVPDDNAPVTGRSGYTDFFHEFYGAEVVYCHDFDGVTIYAGGGAYREKMRRKGIFTRYDINGKALSDFYLGTEDITRTIPTATVGIQLHVGAVALVGVDASLARGVSITVGAQWIGEE